VARLPGVEPNTTRSAPSSPSSHPPPSLPPPRRPPRLANTRPTNLAPPSHPRPPNRPSQPWRAFRPDGVIFFSDILTPLPALGIEFDVIKGKGPVIADPVRSIDAVRALRTLDDPTASLAFTGETLSALRCGALRGRACVRAAPPFGAVRVAARQHQVQDEG
jgi:hypothetical protein